MPRVVLSSALSRWLPGEAARDSSELSLEVAGVNVREALGSVFARYPNLRGYVLDEHGRVRHHVALFVDGDAIGNKGDLSQPLGACAELYVMQALSGG